MQYINTVLLTLCCFGFTACGVCIAQESAGQNNAGKKVQFSEKQLQLKGKKGIGFTLREPGAKQGGEWKENMPRVKALNVSWNYSWGVNLVPVQPEDIEFVPMTWSAGSKLKETLNEAVRPNIKAGKVKRLLAFNEPDRSEQANMPYTKAIELWPDLMDLGVPLCSPSCANPEGKNDDSTQGTPGTWMRDFMREADKRGYRVDYIGVHWYGGSSAESFKGKMKKIYELYGKRPLIITEFAPADWKAKSPGENRIAPEKVLAFMKDALPWIEKQDWIAGYAWFSFDIDSAVGTSSALFNKDGTLTACGRYYKSITPAQPEGDQSITVDAPKK